MPSAAPRNGPAQGVATKAASAPVAKLPVGRASPPSTGRSKARSRLSVIAGGEQHQDRICARVLQLERPARRASPGADREQQTPPSAPVPITAPAA